MSYILDALKKADQERKRGKTPDFITEHEDREDNPKRRVWLYVVLVFFVAAAGSAGWFLGSDKNSSVSEKPQQTSPVTMNTSAQPQPSPPPSVALTSENPTAVPQAQITKTAAPVIVVTPQTEKRETAGKQTARTSQVDKDSKMKKAASATDRGRPSQDTPDAAEPANIKKPVPGNRIYSISELPDEIKQRLPALLISTHIYSQEKSERLTSINGHIGREGQEIMSGITLESITPDGAVLRYQGFKFKVNLK
jgi:general secretion pathway protein B